SISIALTPDVPRSSPRYIWLLLIAPSCCGGLSVCSALRPKAAWRFSGVSRQVVLQEYVDTDALLGGEHRQPVCLRLQDADGTANLVARILIENGIDRSVDECLARRGGELMGDDHRPLARVRYLTERADEPAISGTETVDAVQADVPAKCLANGCLGQRRIVTRLDDRQNGHLGEILRQNRQKAFKPFAMVAHQHGTGK